jgi:hypothetical protein
LDDLLGERVIADLVGVALALARDPDRLRVNGSTWLEGRPQRPIDQPLARAGDRE